MANQRIKYNTLPSNFVDGRILNAEDLNKIIRFSVAGINSNKADIDKLLSGKYNSHVFYSLSELTPNVGEDGDYAFIFFSEDISGENRDTLKVYLKENNVWNDLGELSLLELFRKTKELAGVDQTYVGEEAPTDSNKNIWLKTVTETEGSLNLYSLRTPETDPDNFNKPMDLGDLEELSLKPIGSTEDLGDLEDLELTPLGAPADLGDLEEVELTPLGAPADLGNI